MDLQVDMSAEPATLSLVEPEDLKSLKVAVRGPGTEAELAAALAPVGRLAPGGADAFLDVDLLAGLAGELAADPRWRAAYGEMVAYAGGKGWVDADGRVQAHVERT